MAKLPTGTVTLLFTDIEGSTELVGRLGRPLRRGCSTDTAGSCGRRSQAAGGVEIDCRGDEFSFAFADAASSRRGAAVAAQRALAAHEWPGGRPRFASRMGLHTGEPALEGSSYVGLDVHRVARITDAGHGGQVLVSEPHARAAGVDVRDLGEHRFKGLPEPERIHQVLADGLRRRLPPAAADASGMPRRRAPPAVDPRPNAGRRRRGLGAPARRASRDCSRTPASRSSGRPARPRS